MSKAEDLALEKYPRCSVLVVPARGGGYYADSHLREGFIDGYHQAEKDCLLKINHLVNKVDIDNDAYEDLEDLYDSLCELIKHNRIGYIPEKDLELGWEDIQKIDVLIYAVLDEEKYKRYYTQDRDGNFYEEVLKRFKNMKDGTTSR